MLIANLDSKSSKKFDNSRMDGPSIFFESLVLL